MDEKSTAAVLVKTNIPLQLQELQIPALRRGQVLVDVAYSGLCHSQLLELRGERGVDQYLPHTLGHEGTGVVLDVGEDVSKVKPGDHVVLSWIKGSGIEVPSTLYESGRGTVNSGAISTFMDKTVTCENRVTCIPDAIPLREACLFGCAIPTGAGVVLNVAKARPGDSIAVFGVGGIGMSAVLAANLVHASVVIAVDMIGHKLEQARKIGATHTVDASVVDPLEAIAEITNGRGVDFAIEAAGKQETMENALRCVREHGGLCILAGNLPHGGRITLNPFEFIRGKRLVGTWGGETDPDRDIPLYADLFGAGNLKVGELLTHTYDIHRINEAFDDLEAGRVVRGLIDMRKGLA